MLRGHTYLLGLALLALGVVVALMAAGVIPAQRSSVLGALLADDPTTAPSAPTATVTPIDRPIAFDGLRPGRTDPFGLRAGLVVVNAIYDGTVEPFSAFLQPLDDPQAAAVAPIVIVPPLDRQGAATAQIAAAGRYALNVERADGEWAVTIAQPGASGNLG